MLPEISGAAGMKAVLAILALALSAWCPCAMGLDRALDISQYGHTSWTARDGLSVGAIFAMAQTPDGYLWLGTEFGLFRFDGVKAVAWQPPEGQSLPNKPYSLLVTHDGTLWIGTFAGLVSWDGVKLTRYPEIGDRFATSLLEDHDGTVWAGVYGPPEGKLCSIREGHVQCDSAKGAFGMFVWSLHQDRAGNLWVASESGLWQWKPGAPKRYATYGARIDDVGETDEGRVLVAIHEAGLKHIVDNKLESYQLHSTNGLSSVVPDKDIDSNKLLRDRDGGDWIGTHWRGILHVHDGRTEIFRTSEGLSGDIICSLFEDREGNIWVGTSRGLDRFRELPITAASIRSNLSDTDSLIATKDRSVWVATHEGLIRWRNGQVITFKKTDGLPDNMVQSLYEDEHGRLWAFTARGLAYLSNGRFVSVEGGPSPEVYSITGDNAGDLWLSGNKGLSHLLNGRFVENTPWAAVGRQQQAKVVVFDPARGGLWLGFWLNGGVLYFKDGVVKASYTTAEGLGAGPAASIRLDQDSVLWASTEEGGLSRIKDGRVATLTTNNGLPCDAVHWSIEDNDRAVWLYTACGLVRITRPELDAWIADPTHRIQTTLWDASDGVRLSGTAPSTFGPPVAKARDGKLWFHTGEGVDVVDPHHVAFNKLPPPVHILEVIADQKTYWGDFPGMAVANLRLPPRTRDLTVDYAALSLTAPEKIHFKYKLEGQDSDWKEVVNKREAQYTNLAPGKYTFRVIASNNSGVWNEQGDTLEFSIAPAYYQTNWFRALCAVLLLALLWAMYHLRVRHLQHEFELTLDARLDERTRIARDLHDTLLQSFHGLLFRFQAVRNLLPKRPEEAIQALDAALVRSEEALDEGRSSIQNLRPEGAPENELDRTLMATGQELASVHQNGGDPPQFKMIVEGERRPLSPLVKEEVIRVARELLRNAFQHARARNIEAEVRYEHDVFRLIIRDDGTGIDPKILKDGGRSGHWGLPGVHERATEIGAKLEFWSEAGAGTEVRLTVPSAIAFGKPRSVLRFKLFRDRRIHEHKS